MNIDIISDIHLDSHLKYLEPDDSMVADFWKCLQPKAETLVIAGDIGHSNLQNINILKALRRNFYKNILLVLGNHDYYIREGVVKYFHGQNGLITDLPKFSASKDRVQEFRHMCNDVDGIHILDGNVIEIEGIKFGGAMGWYDGKYYEANKDKINFGKVNLQAMWQDSMDDDIYIKPKMSFDGFLEEERVKIENVLMRNPDIMITHVNPSIKIEHQYKSYAKYISTSFFSYDGQKHMEEFNGKYWIFGHSHFDSDFDIDGRFRLISNCLGYRNESANKRIKTIEI